MNSQRSEVGVLGGGPGEEAEHARALAARLNLPLVHDRQDAAMILCQRDDRLVLCDSDGAGPGVSVDFAHLPVRHGRVQVSKREPLGHAFGRDVRTIVDATAGLGQDAFLLACMGFEVTAVERSPVLFALLENGLERARNDGRLSKAIGDRLHLVHSEATEFLESLEPKPDAVYLDPMFPPKRKKSALAKKSVRVVRALVGDDPDAGALLNIALLNATRRVVVKRPDDAPPLMPRPVASHGGKTVRYDVYHPTVNARALRLEH